MPRDLALRLTLLDVSPEVWRRLRLPAAATLADLHAALQAAFGWHDRGLHQITDFAGHAYTDRSLDADAPAEVLDSRATATADVLPAVGDRLSYEYHFNDEWEVDVVRERDPHGAGVERPFLVAGARAAPPEGCGGPHDYEEVLAALADPAHAEHQELRDWLPPDFDPAHCDGAEIRRRLRALPLIGRAAESHPLEGSSAVAYPWGMVCPNCRSEFRPGITTCPDCNVPLVDSVPEERHDQAAWVEVAETADPSLLPVLRSALEGAGIPCLLDGEEAVGIFPLGLNDTHFAQSGIAARLMVPADRLAEARELLDTAASSQEMADNDASAPPESSDDRR